MKLKKLFMILFVVALMMAVFSVHTFAATKYTVTVKSNDGSETLWTQTVDSGSEFEILTYGARIVGSVEADYYNYSGSRQFLGFATSANATTISSFYAVGYTKAITGNLTLYVVDGDRMGAHTIVGDPITGAEIYELWEKDFKLLKPHPELDNYLLFKYTELSYEVDSVTYYGVFVSSNVSNSSNSFLEFGFPEGNKGYYKFAITTLEEAIEYLLTEQTISSFTEVEVPQTLTRHQYFTGIESIYSNALYRIDNKTSSSTAYYSIPLKKIAESSELSFDLETLGLANGSHTFKVKAKGAGYYDSDFSNELTYVQAQKYSVTTTFTNLTAYNNYDMAGDFSYVYLNKPLSLCLTPAYGYLQPDEIVVTMGGTTLTAGTGYYYNAKDGSLVIPKVTGDITISAQGLLKVAAPVIEKEETGAFDFLYPLGLKFNEVKNASGYAAYVDGEEITDADLKITVNDGVVTMLIPKTAFPENGTYQVYVKALPVEGYMASNPSNSVTVDVTLHMLPAEIVEAPEYMTDEYLYAFKVSYFDLQATGFGVFLDGVRCDDVNWEILEDGEYFGYVQIPAEAFVGGDGSFEIYLETYGPDGSIPSGPSNVLTCTVAKLATPEIRLE